MGSYHRDSTCADPSNSQTGRPLIVIGITHSQTCLVLTGRLRALREAGFRVVLIASPGPLLESTAAEEGVEPLAIPMERGIAPLADLVALFRLTRALIRLRPDIAEFSTPKAGLLGSFAGLLCGVPRRVYLLRGLRLETASGIKRRILLTMEQLAAACSHVVLCNSRSLRERALELRVADKSKLRLLGYGSGNGVDVEHFTPHSMAETGMRGAPIIGFVGRLTRDKGIPELIEAFNALLKKQPAARLLLVGWYDESEDALPPELRAHIDRHPNIVRTGFVKDTAPCYRMMDFLVLGTLREGFPNVVLEAAASGIPVITTNATGAQDAVLHGVTGLLIPPGRPDLLTEAMLELVENAPRRRQMGAAARRWVTERFVRAQVQAVNVAFYEGMLQVRESPQVQVAVRDAAAAD
jgi:glycosyltransferase involved in cell wall biosynthesis